MTIRRRLPDPAAEPPARRPLGRVLVTIDDLQALIDLLKECIPGTGEVSVLMDEGTFSEAEDMRRLSDETLADLRIGVRGVIVVLSRDRAEVIGSPDMVDLVDLQWARPRRTRKRPSGTTSLRGPAIAMAVVLLVGLLNSYIAGYTALETLGLLSCLALVGATGMALLRIFGGPENCAVVVPLTRHELREREAAQSRVPLWSLIVAIVVAVISIAFNEVFSPGFADRERISEASPQVRRLRQSRVESCRLGA